MKRRTGNGTSAKQWLYVFWNFPFIWVVKIGISGNVKYRRKRVSESSPGFDVPIWFVRIPFAYQVEQGLHRALFFLRVPFSGSGHTERFFILAAIPAIVISLLVFLLEWTFYFALIFAAAYLISQN